ncbi:MAG: dTMP kinase [Candidatus Portnoybacteria bacterium CG09_land_8_20_14_0_10_44_13]|uniref:Thymidylate kinase n=2 Tax=Candidatus Portnoyibacteriota TaxID=1817913 RepID=A0A2H0WY52_9BACT|nr:MAG: dTMP kinase [Candidatus Portnoybacteria bacterium CG09_land_8_20_14_0_10_44_13]
MKKNLYKGKFIVFEGLDGSGLSTQAKLLGDYLQNRGPAHIATPARSDAASSGERSVAGGREVILTKEPTMDSEAGRQIRAILDEKIKIEAAEIQRLFVQDRKEHLDNLIIPALRAGKIVISDRYFFSTLAFGAVSSNLEWLIGLNKDFLLPDMTFLLLVRPEICVDRIIKRGEGVKLFEKLPTLEKVYKNYQIIAERFENVYVVNGEESAEEVFEEIKNEISKLLK